MLVDAAFVRRPHRFAVEADLDDGRRVVAHLGDPGRLRELLVDRAPLRLRPAPPGSPRKTRYTVALVRSPQPPCPWVSVEPGRANTLADTLLREGRVRGVPRSARVRREVARGRSRFDFLAEIDGEPDLWVEVKSAALVENGVALFPDAPTERGRRHVEELRECVLSGERALVLFVVQRHDARAVRPHRGIDPAFATALSEAKAAGVALRAARFEFDGKGRATYGGAIPVRC